LTTPRAFIDECADPGGQRDVGIDHAYAVTSHAATGSTHAVTTSRIDEASTRAEAYVDITRGRQTNISTSPGPGAASTANIFPDSHPIPSTKVSRPAWRLPRANAGL
jgi:hypothetical protein